MLAVVVTVATSLMLIKLLGSPQTNGASTYFNMKLLLIHTLDLRATTQNSCEETAPAKSILVGASSCLVIALPDSHAICRNTAGDILAWCY